MSVRPPGSRRSRRPPRPCGESPDTGQEQAVLISSKRQSAQATQRARNLKLVVLEERRERAEAAGPPGPAMLEVLRAAREVHRAEGALRMGTRRPADGAAPSKPSNAQVADDGEPPAAPAEVMGRRQREDLQRAQERLRAVLRRAGAAESERLD